VAKKSFMSKIADAVLGPDKGPTRPHPAIVMDDNVMLPIPPAPKTRRGKKARAPKKAAKKPATRKKKST
jgi:hypothetical protein